MVAVAAEVLALSALWVGDGNLLSVIRYLLLDAGCWMLDTR